MNLISCQELKLKIEQNQEFKLVNAMDEPQFHAAHIPGSLNICKIEDAQGVLSPEDEIIVYCADESCNKSIILYQLLDERGYKRTYRFAGGLRAWQEAGYELVGEMIS